MANGSYYTISRQATYASLFNYNSDKLILKIDSLLYESIPGKIISKKEIIASNGIRGIDIINKTKRSDLQRYQIYFTENEIIIFKMIILMELKRHVFLNLLNLFLKNQNHYKFFLQQQKASLSTFRQLINTLIIKKLDTKV